MAASTASTLTTTTSTNSATISSPTPTKSADTSARERSFACTFPDCTSRFHRKFTLREHIKTHTGEKPYQCPIKTCAKRFTTSGNLSRHRHMHMAKRICCPVLDCARSFAKQEKLLRHLKVHMGNAAYACSFPGCPKTFSTSGNLSRHLRTQHRGFQTPDSPETLMAKLPLSPVTNSFQVLCRSPADISWQAQEFVAPLQNHYSLQQHQKRQAMDNDVYDLLDCLFDPAAQATHSVPIVSPDVFTSTSFSFASALSECVSAPRTHQEPELYSVYF